MLRTSIAAVLIASLVGTSGCATLRKKKSFQDADYFLRKKTASAVEFTSMAAVGTALFLVNGLLDTEDINESYGEQLDEERSYEAYHNSQ